MTRPHGFTILAVLIAWYAVGSATLGLRFLGADGDAGAIAVGVLGLAAAGAGLAAALGLWQLRPWAPRAVWLWGAGMIVVFGALFVALPPLPGGGKPWGSLAAGAGLFLAITWGLARYVRSRLG